MFDFVSVDELSALFQVVMIDVALAGDNAIVVGMAAAGLPLVQRRRAILIGILAAAVLRIIFSIFTVQLLKIVGLMVAGGILLLWVSWKLWREIRTSRKEEEAAEAALEDKNGSGPPTKTLSQAVTQIVVADVSMSLDNVLAVAGAAREHLWVLIVGLGLSVVLMGLAANIIAKLLHRYHWIAYVGLAIILYVSLAMIWDGSKMVMAAANGG